MRTPSKPVRIAIVEDQARVAVDGLMAGTGVDVHQAMIATEKASMAFELALAVRNKAVKARPGSRASSLRSTLNSWPSSRVK